MRTVYHTAVEFLDAHVDTANALYRARRDAMLDALDRYMPEGVTWSRPEGGFFIWIALPEGIHSDVLFDRSAEHGVIVFPGELFFEHRDNFGYVRLSFSTVPEDRIRLGIERLGDAIREMMA
jgi:2-aminoadipate transaminase